MLLDTMVGEAASGCSNVVHTNVDPGIITSASESLGPTPRRREVKRTGTMSEDSNAAAWPAAEPRAKAGRFDQTSIALHWLTVVLVAAQLTTGWLLSHGGDEIPALLTTHRSIGIAIWIIVAARLVWRHGFAHLPPFPASMPKLQQRLAKLSEYALYALL